MRFYIWSISSTITGHRNCVCSSLSAEPEVVIWEHSSPTVPKKGILLRVRFWEFFTPLKIVPHSEAVCQHSDFQNQVWWKETVLMCSLRCSFELTRVHMGQERITCVPIKKWWFAKRILGNNSLQKQWRCLCFSSLPWPVVGSLRCFPNKMAETLILIDVSNRGIRLTTGYKALEQVEFCCCFCFVCCLLFDLSTMVWAMFFLWALHFSSFLRTLTLNSALTHQRRKMATTSSTIASLVNARRLQDRKFHLHLP